MHVTMLVPSSTSIHLLHGEALEPFDSKASNTVPYVRISILIQKS